MVWPMLIAEAREALKRPLVFGDDQQIRAIRFLDAVAAAVTQIRESPVCESCDGHGQFETGCVLCETKGRDDDCDECDGDGRIVVDCEACGQLGYFVTDWPACKNDVMKAAIEQIKTERFLQRRSQ